MDQPENNPGVAPEQATPSQLEVTPPGAETQTNTTPTQESEPQTSAVSPQATSAPQTSVVPPQTTTVPQSGVVEGKKSHAGIIVLIVVLVVLLLLGGLAFVVIKTVTGTVKNVINDASSIIDDAEKEISGGGNNSGGTVKPESNPIVDASNKMLNELGSFDYTATITSSAMGMDMDSVMNCTYDGNNKTEHCKSELFGGSVIEYYYDWGNGYEYTYMDLSYDFDEMNNKWTKTSLPSDQKGGVVFDEGATFTYTKSENVDGGTKYTGTVKGFTGSSEFDVDPDLWPETSFEVFINSDGYIETINFDMDDENMGQTTKVVYSNFGTAQPVIIPEEALNS